MNKILQLLCILSLAVIAFQSEANAAPGKCYYVLEKVAVTATAVSWDHGNGSIVYTVTGTTEAVYTHKDNNITKRTITLPANQTVTVNSSEPGDLRANAEARARGLLDTEASDKKEQECKKNGCNNQQWTEK